FRRVLFRSTAPTAPQEGAAPLVLAGKSLARRQLDFALAAGCRQIIALGPGSSAEDLALRRAAEDRGARFDTIMDAAGLSARVGPDDELLVLMPRLLPESPALLEVLAHGPAVLVLPAASGTAAGFERIDLERAWAGAAMIPGALIERLADLPADIDPASALMRAALQTHVPEHAVPEALVASGQWTPLHLELAVAEADEAWLLRNSSLIRDLPEWLSIMAVRFAGRALATQRLGPMSWLLAALLLTIGVLTGWLGHPAAGLALVALATIAARVAQELARLQRAPFGRPGRRLPEATGVLVDLAIAACVCMAIEGTWLQRLFSPLVLMA